MYGKKEALLSCNLSIKIILYLSFIVSFVIMPSSIINGQRLSVIGNDLCIIHETVDSSLAIKMNGRTFDISLKSGVGKIEPEPGIGMLFLEVPTTDKHALYRFYSDDGRKKVKPIPLWLSILPPLIAIGLALLLKEVVVSLFAGIWLGAFLIGGFTFDGLFSSFFRTIDQYLIPALNDSGHLSVIVFSLFIGGMVAVISRNGGMAGVVNKLSAIARTEKSAQFSTWLLGIAIFFDDYANTLIVGNTMRSVTDKFRISREKLAYIVDSTAAPVAAIAFITTWIGAELGYIQDGIQLLEGYSFTSAPYSIFIQSLKYSFYPVLALIFILLIIWKGKDYGPMWKAEMRARTTGQVSPASTEDEDEPDMEDLSPVKGAPLNWKDAAVPVLFVITGTFAGLLITGYQYTYQDLIDSGVTLNSESFTSVWSALGETGSTGFFQRLGTLIGNSDSYVALLWASFSGLALALIITVGKKIMGLFDAMHTMVTGFKTIIPAIIILALAWSLALTTEQLHTADFISEFLEDKLAPQFIPMLVFVLAALIAFSTGSSWSTMAILYPIAIPASWELSIQAGLSPEQSFEIMLNAISVTLGASVLGDHCSPISDTTILSSLASDCNHIDHVRTQLPYAITVGAVSLLLCGLSAFLGGNWGVQMIFLTIGIVVLYIIITKIGKSVDGDRLSL
jgi:Na+/H+ antiporter NhaC